MPRAAARPSGTGSNGLPVECDKAGLVFVTAQVGWLASACNGVSPDVLLVTRDGGARWALAWVPGGDSPQGPPAIDETTDSGRTWTVFTPSWPTADQPGAAASPRAERMEGPRATTAPDRPRGLALTQRQQHSDPAPIRPGSPPRRAGR